jgi:hypothetical protein
MIYEEHVKESAERYARIQERREMFTTQDMARIAQQAWDATKPEGDPAFTHPDHSVDHRNLLLSNVKDFIQTGKPGDPRLQAFEVKVAAIVEELKNPRVPTGEMTFDDAAAEKAKAETEAPKPFVDGEIIEEHVAEPVVIEPQATVVEPTGNS